VLLDPSLEFITNLCLEHYARFPNPDLFPARGLLLSGGLQFTLRAKVAALLARLLKPPALAAIEIAQDLFHAHDPAVTDVAETCRGVIALINELTITEISGLLVSLYFEQSERDSSFGRFSRAFLSYLFDRDHPAILVVYFANYESLVMRTSDLPATTITNMQLFDTAKRLGTRRPDVARLHIRESRGDFFETYGRARENSKYYINKNVIAEKMTNVTPMIRERTHRFDEGEYRE
jgi:hypothetical protein